MAGFFPSCVTGLSIGVSADPLHVLMTTSVSFPLFLALGHPPYPVGWCKVNLAEIFKLLYSPLLGTHLHTKTAERVPCVLPSLFYSSLSAFENWQEGTDRIVKAAGKASLNRQLNSTATHNANF